MINLLKDYIFRSLPDREDFSTNPNLRKKVSEGGDFLPFYGNTLVFDLSDETKEQLQLLQASLYRSAGWMLSRQLDPSTFHMTLHDLVNGPERTPALQHRMTEAETAAKQLMPYWQNQPPLRMKTTWLFNMVNTSIVLGLEPADEDSLRRLDEMYMSLETVVPLGYALTPHITMAYFLPGTYTRYDLDCLRKALQPVELDISLNLSDLYYQEFTDMNHYVSK